MLSEPVMKKVTTVVCPSEMAAEYRERSRGGHLECLPRRVPPRS
ncbi:MULTISPECIES: hypothetical protein [Rhodococcus]|jgi:hypothetical protein|nr:MULTISPECIES: hypothetical protein [Rhodococcus]MDI9977428.1 hypothetical protein [Rhodococcus sp. IEGM 1307]WKN60603.1 hypothetical protein HJ581_0043735 [Rhodococcus opacus]